MNVIAIPTLKDNYSYCLTQEKSQEVIIIDAGESAPIINFCHRHNFNIVLIVITHHHYDHTDGIDGLLEHFPLAKLIKPDDFKEHRTLPSNFGQLLSIRTPGHTLDHICYYNKPHLFTGDLLFHLGCGRIFEGSYEQMYKSLRLISTLPLDTLIYPGHEYTHDNAEFCKSVFQNTPLEKDYQQLKKSLAIDRPTIPTTLATQLNKNPFLAYHWEQYKNILHLQDIKSDFEFFKWIRQKKDNC